MANDGSVEVRITGAVDPSLAASAQAAKAEIAGLGEQTSVSAKAMSDALKAAGGDLSKVTPAMLGMAGAASAAAATETELTAATAAETVATNAATASHVSARASYEGLVLVHEALMGRYTRMIPSAMILTQAWAGQGAVAGALGALLSPVGLAIAAVTVAAVAATVATVQYNAQQEKLTATTIGLGAASGLTAGQLQTAADQAAESSGKSGSAMLASAEAFADAGVKSQSAIAQLSADVQVYADLTGVKAAEAQKTLAEAMADPAKGAETLNEKLGILDSTTLEHIKNLQAAGEKDQAVAALLQALQTRMDEAKSAGVGLNGEFGQLAAGAANFWSWLGKVNQQLELFQQFGFASGAIQARAKAQGDAAAAAAQRQAQLNSASVAGAGAFAGTPEGEDVAKRQSLTDNLTKAQAALAADTQLHGANSEAVQRDREAIADYTRAINTYLPAAQKAHEIAGLDAQIAEARHKHNQQLVDDLTRRKALVQEAGKVESDAQAQQAAADAGALGAARTGAGHTKHGPSQVQEWTEMLRQQEVASGDFFKDQTADELKFWKDKLSQTTKGSKDWLEVQARIYEAQKTLARQGYDEHLATLNDQIEADKDSWSKEQADWNAKLAFIKAHFGEESKEYKDAHRDFEAAERQHQATMLQIQRDGERAALAVLKENLDAQRSIRQEDARTAEALISQQARYSANPLAETQAAAQIMALHKQVAEQDIADAEAAYMAEDHLRTQAVVDALHDYGQDSKQYADAASAKQAADAQFYAQHRVAENQMVQQSIADALRVQSAWHSAIDPLVSSFGNAFKGVITGSQTAKQALLSIGSTILDVILSAIEKWIAAQIVQMIMGKSTAAAQIGTEKAQVASYAALAGAAGVASFAAAPWPIDTGAPAFGAAMAAAAMSLGSFADGVNVVPQDMIAQVHAGERIMPAADNRALMDALDGASGPWGLPPISVGDMHYHAAEGGFDDDEFRKAATRHATHITETIDGVLRGGWRPRGRRPAYGVF